MNSIRRNLAWLLLSQAATWLVSVAALLIVPRMLGDAEFGQLSFVVVFIGFFDLLGNLGINSFLVKVIARDTKSVGRYVVNAIMLKFVLTTSLLVIGFGLAFALGFSDTMMVLFAAFSIGLLINVVGLTIGAALTGLQQMVNLAKWNMLQGYVGGLGSLLILVNGGPLWAYALFFNLAFLIPIPANLRRLWPYLRESHAIDVRLWLEILRGGLPFFVLAALIVVYGTIDVPLLQAMTGSEEVGWYALAYRWVSVPAFFAATVAGVVFPALSAEGAKVSPAFITLANRAVRIVVFVATPAAVGIALIAEPFLTLLYHGEFQNAIPLLRILALHIPIVGFDIVLGCVAMASDRQRNWVIVSVGAALFNPLLNLVFIPQSQRLWGNGAIGAAIVTVLTEVILMVGAIGLRPKGVLDKVTVNNLLRIVLASATMIPVVLSLDGAPLGIQVAAGMVAYALASFALRTISISELKHSGKIANRRSAPETEILPEVLLVEDAMTSV
jgi:O-antigen/teichoic acid export membrane protein